MLEEIKNWLQKLMGKFNETKKLKEKNEAIQKAMTKIEKRHRKMVERLWQSDTESLFSSNKLHKFDAAEFSSIINTPDYQRNDSELNPYKP